MSLPNPDPFDRRPEDGGREIMLLVLMAVMVGLAAFGMLLATGAFGGPSL